MPNVYIKGKKFSNILHQKRKILIPRTNRKHHNRKKKKGKEGKKNRRKNSHIPGFKLLIVKRMQKKKKTQTTQSARIRFLIIDNIYVAIMVYGES